MPKPSLPKPLRASVIAVCGCLIALSALGQPPANKVDSKGRKQGAWTKHYADGGVMYTGQFKDDQPMGRFERFYEDSTLQASIDYAKLKARAVFYYPGGDSIVMASGPYIDQKRDSIWTFYSADGTITSRENYSKGFKEGQQIIYYPDGAISEKTEFAADVQNGNWEQFFPDGKPKLKAYVVNGVNYEGEYISYYPDGSFRQKGKYLDGKKESSWYDHNEDGSIYAIYVYRNGNIIEAYPKNGLFEAYYPNDIKKDEVNYKDGQKHGLFKTYFPKGDWVTEKVKDPDTGEERLVQRFYGAQVEQEGKYLNGELHGEVVTYAEDGKVLSRKRYDKGVLVP